MFKNKLLGLVIVLAVLKVDAVKKGIASYINICKHDDPDIKKCLFDNVETIRPYLKSGIPEMRIPGVDPLFVPKVTMELQGFRAAFINASVAGCTDFVLKGVELDLEKNYFGLRMFFPKVYLTGNYEFSGKLLLLELNGKGFSSTNITNLNSVADMRGKRESRNGKTYINFDDNKLKLEVGSARMNFGNLFGDNKELTDATNRIVNENADDFIKELLPIVEETVGAFIFSTTSEVFKAFPLETLFP